MKATLNLLYREWPAFAGYLLIVGLIYGLLYWFNIGSDIDEPYVPPIEYKQGQDV